MKEINQKTEMKAKMAVEKDYIKQVEVEYSYLQTNPTRGETVSQTQILINYPVDLVNKGVFTVCENGEPFRYIRIEMNELGATENKLKAKIKRNEYLDGHPFLHPVLKSFSTKSDRTRNAKDIRKTIAITQKLEYVGNLKNSVKKAVSLGGVDNYKEMKEFAKKNGISLKGCGVVFDHYQRKFKAVFVDY